MVVVIDKRVHAFDSVSTPIELDDERLRDGDAIDEDGKITLTQGTRQDLTFAIQPGRQVVIDLGGHTLTGNLRVTNGAEGSLLITNGSIRGNVTITSLLDFVVQNVRVFEGGIDVVSVSGNAFFDALSVSRAQDTAIRVRSSANVMAHAIAIDNVWLPTEVNPADAMHFEATGTVEVRQVQAQTISSFSARMRVLVLTGGKVFAADVAISNASAPRGTVEGVVPTSEAPTGPVLGNISVQAHSGGEISQMQLTHPDGGILVTRCQGDGVTRPVVADISRTHGAVAPHFKEE